MHSFNFQPTGRVLKLLKKEMNDSCEEIDQFSNLMVDAKYDEMGWKENFKRNILKDISLMLNNADDCNVIIQVGKDQNAKEFYAHSSILRVRSQYFKNAFLNKLFTIKNEMIIFNEPSINPTVFELILRYIYTGELSLSRQLGGNDIFDLLLTSDELLFEELLDYIKDIQDYLIKEESAWIQQNLLFVLRSVFKREKYKKLQEFCFESICVGPQPLNEFLLLDKDMLYYLLERYEFRILNIEEGIVWDFLIKWGIKQIPELKNKNNQDEWTGKNYEDLKNMLNNFIPLIKFLDIKSEDFYCKVRPYKSIIPCNTYEETIAYYLVGQPNLIHIETKIIKPKLADTVIFNIIKNNSNYCSSFVIDLPYKFKLIYRGSRDGIDNKSLEDRCIDRVESLVLIKTQESSKIFVGYSSLGFKSRQANYSLVNVYYYHKSDIILSFKDSEDIQGMKMSRVSSLNRLSNYYSYAKENPHNSECDSLRIVNQKLYTGLYNGNGVNIYDEKSWTTTNIYTIEEIEAFVKVNRKSS